MPEKYPRTRLPRALRACIYALFLALICMLLTPLAAAACGGMFTADAYTEQSAERMIFAVGKTEVTLYEQIKYTGSPKDFAWVLPLPAVPQIATAPTTLFQTLDNDTAPDISTNPSNCNMGGGGAAPSSSAPEVNVYSNGTVGPYSYDVISSDDPQALTQWLTAHNYKIPAESQAEIQIYTSAHMFFLAMRLKGSAGVENMTPVKITYPSTDQQITIPLRMATPMSKERLGVTVWIFGTSRYTPQNYGTLQISDSQLSADPDPSNDYTTLVSQAVDSAGGHGFITDYAHSTSTLYTAGVSELQDLQKNYSYLTRLYTNIAPNQITLDPTFGAKAGMPNVSNVHALTSPPTPCWPSVERSFTTLLLITAVVILLILFIRRKIRRATYT